MTQRRLLLIVLTAATALLAAGCGTARVAGIHNTPHCYRNHRAACILFKADGSNTLSNEWAEISSYDGGINTPDCARDSTGQTDPEVFQQSSVLPPYAPTGEAYEFIARASEAPVCYSGTRTELGQALPNRGSTVIGSGSFTATRYLLSGNDYWASFWMRLCGGSSCAGYNAGSPTASDFPIGTSNWQVVTQFKQVQGDAGTGTAGDSPYADMQIGNGQLYWFSTDSYPLGSVSLNTWMKITVHLNVSASPTGGYVQVYGNLNCSTASCPESFLGPTAGNCPTSFSSWDATNLRCDTQTAAPCTDSFAPGASCSTAYGLSAGATLPDHSRIGIYRNSVIGTSSDTGEYPIGQTATDYYAGYTVAPTRRAAEAGAFGGSY